MKPTTLLAARQAAATKGKVHLRLPLLFGLAAALVLLAAAGPTLPVSLAAMGLVVAAIPAGRVLTHRHEMGVAAARHEAAAQVNRLTQLYAACVPVWVRQLETVRSEADTEVGRLARVFGEITRKLDKAIGPSRLARSSGGTAQREILESLARNGRELETLVAALRLLQTSKQRIVEQIGVEAARLRDNASDIRQIALHTRMVSLNATIEAARAGQAGKPFAVIINDMRTLATRTAEASELFSRHTERLHAMVGAAFQEQGQTDSQVVSIAGAEELVNKVVASSEATMRQLTREIEAMEDERKDIREDISQVLVSLQFQDRVSQILSHVTSNLEEMRTHLRDADGDAMDDRQWLTHMASDYSTHEEFDNHSGVRTSRAEPDAAVTYF